MSIEDNKALVRRIEEAMNAHDVEAAVALIAPEPTNHGRPVGRAGFRQTFTDIFATFPDWQNTIEEIIAEGDAVVVHNLTTATHLGTPSAIPIHNMKGIAATGRRVVMRSIHIGHVRDGLAMSHAAVRDDLETMKQVGLWPPSLSSACPPTPDSPASFDFSPSGLLHRGGRTCCIAAYRLSSVEP